MARAASLATSPPAHVYTLYTVSVFVPAPSLFPSLSSAAPGAPRSSRSASSVRVFAPDAPAIRRREFLPLFCDVSDPQFASLSLLTPLPSIQTPRPTPAARPRNGTIATPPRPLPGGDVKRGGAGRVDMSLHSVKNRGRSQ